MTDKYEILCRKDPKEAATAVGVVERRNYLAHTIRDIEHVILQKQGKHYHVITHVSEYVRISKIDFYDNCCEIYLTDSCEEMDDRCYRLTLAHELGHLVYNIDKLENPEVSFKGKDISTEEEVYAWEFAYHLIQIKSEGYKSNVKRNEFIYEADELKKSLLSLIYTRNPTVYNHIAKFLKLQN